MAHFIPNTKEQQKEMLTQIGLNTIGDLFQEIPKGVRLNRELNLPPAYSEMELLRHMKNLSQKNAHLDDYVCFLGAGAYDHFIPSAIDHLISRQEFYTAYTPYQPEISQGTLQTIFEFQTMICELTGMDIANASMYDGASALAEAVLMACQAVRRQEVLVARSVHPESRDVIRSYTGLKGINVREIGYKNDDGDNNSGQLDLVKLEESLSVGTVAAVVLQTPNFFGIIESLKEIAEITHRHKALLIVSVDPISLGVLKPPGEFGADIVVGEGQALGNALSFGGPYLGFFCTTEKLLRKMPGRIVGQTKDINGNRGFSLTIQTREQHIRREKATSNICSNQALNALIATIYLTLLGKQGLKEVASLSLQKSHYAYESFVSTPAFSPVFNAPFFKEFVIQTRLSPQELNKSLLEDKFIGGYTLKDTYPELENGWLVAVTEKRTKGQIDEFIKKAGVMQQ